MPGRKHTCYREQDRQCTYNIVARSRYHFTVETVIANGEKLYIPVFERNYIPTNLHAFTRCI